MTAPEPYPPPPPDLRVSGLGFTLTYQNLLIFVGSYCITNPSVGSSYCITNLSVEFIETLQKVGSGRLGHLPQAPCTSIVNTWALLHAHIWEFPKIRGTLL